MQISEQAKCLSRDGPLPSERLPSSTQAERRELAIIWESSFFFSPNLCMFTAVSLKEYTQPQLWEDRKQEKQRDTAKTQTIELVHKHPAGGSNQGKRW